MDNLVSKHPNPEITTKNAKVICTNHTLLEHESLSKWYVYSGFVIVSSGYPDCIPILMHVTVLYSLNQSPAEAVSNTRLRTRSVEVNWSFRESILLSNPCCCNEGGLSAWTMSSFICFLISESAKFSIAV